MSKATLNHPTKEANHQFDCEYIPVRVYQDSSLACQKIIDEIIDQINQKSASKPFVWAWRLAQHQLKYINTSFTPIKRKSKFPKRTLLQSR